MSSYPQTGTNWRDLSGNSNTSALTNGPTWDSNGWLVFDGVDDYSVGPGTLGSDCTVELWISSSNYASKIPISIDGNSYGSGPNMYFECGTINWNTGDGCGNPFSNSYYPNAQWHHIVITNDYNVTAKLYIDGKLIGTANPLDATTAGANKFWIARFHGDNNYTIAARITAARIYNNALTEAQVKQNYFGAPIVTDSLVFDIDANNIVSYPKSGTSTYNLTGSGATGTLTNGTSFNISNGGSFMFDGTNDYIVFPNDTNLDSQAITMESWSNISTLFQNGFLFEKGTVNTQYSNFFNSDGTFYFRTMGLSIQDLTFYCPSYISPNTWNHIVCTYGNGIKTIYVNGIQVVQQTGITGTIPTSTAGLFIGQHGSGGYLLNGKIANSKVYNRALTAGEVQQNYQAEQYRFETYPGIPTNGLILHLDAGNRQSYPGSGTVWYDISGQGANADLVNGVTWNSSGYFFFDGTDDIANSINISQEYRDLVIGIWSESNGGLEMVFSLYGGFDASFRLSNNVLNAGGGNSDDWQFGSSDLVFIDGTYNDTTNLGSQFHFVRTYRSNNVDFGTSFRYSLSSTFLSRFFKGKIAFVLCYNRQLSDAEVRGLYYYYKDRFPF
jgi:hypothetical protein